MKHPNETRTVHVQGYGFVVDTESYARSFERQVVAHMTGCFGDCGVGDDTAKKARKSLRATPEGRRFRRWCKRYVESKPDEHGCCRPASIYPTPGWFSDGMGGAYRESEAGSSEVAARYVKATRDYFMPYAEQADKRAAEAEAAGRAEEAEEWRREAAGNRKSIEDATQRGPGRHASYQSVIVWLNRRPPSWVIEIMKTRAAEFLGTKCEFDGPHKVIGFRVVRLLEMPRAKSV